MSNAYVSSGGGGGGGSGTVTSFSFTDANGFDGTVTNPTTTPNLSLTTTVADTRVMFSNSGAITGDAGLTYTSATDTLHTGILALPPSTDTAGFISINIDSIDFPVFGIYENSTADGQNAFIGCGPGVLSSITGTGNIAVDYTSETLINLTSGDNNIGMVAFTFLTSGSNNVGIAACSNLLSGNHNLVLGFCESGGGPLDSGFNYTTNESANILLKNIGVTGESHVIRIGTQGSGTGQQSTCYIAGIVGVTTSNSQAVTIDSTTGQLGVTTISPARPIVTVSGTTKTFALSDAQTWQECSNAATQTLTVPTNASVAFPTGTEIDVFQEGAGQVVFAAAGGVTINSAFGNLKIATQYTGASLKKTGTNTWALVGNLTA